MSTMTVEYKGINGRFASLNTHELVADIQSRVEFAGWQLDHTRINRGHIKAAQRVGGGERVYITARNTMPVQIGTEMLYPQVRIIDQTYPGACLTVEFGFYRKVCSNGLYAFGRVAQPIRIPHYKNRTEMMLRLTDIILESAKQFALISEQVPSWASMPVNPIAAIESLAATNLLSLTRVKQLSTIIRLGLHRPEDNPTTVWGLYNLINELERVRARRGSTAYLDRDRQLLDTIIQVA